MIERAIRRSFEDSEDIDIADKFMCKIIQNPLSLPASTEDEVNNFLKYQLRHEPKTRSSFQDEDDTDYGTSNDDVEDAENRVVENRAVDINSCDPLVSRCPVLLPGWIAWAARILLKERKFQGLKYGSIPLTIMITLWTALKSIISVVKRVSVQMMGYIHLQIIQVGLVIRSRNWFGLYSDSVENTSKRKFRSASEDDLRIITFVEDLDRCEEKVILEVLLVVNLILSRCKISVVLGIERKMIERAIRRSFEDSEDIDKADVEDTENRVVENRAVDINSCDPLVSRCPGIITWLRYFLKIPYSIASKISNELQRQRDELDEL